MRIGHRLSLVAFLISFDSSADILKLRVSCQNEAPNCFEQAVQPGDPNQLTGMERVLNEVHSPTLPGRLRPGQVANGEPYRVVVDIGPGSFSAAPAINGERRRHCEPAGGSNLRYLTFSGAGAGVTFLEGGGFDGGFVVSLKSCSDVEFRDLTIAATPGVSHSGVAFSGDGSTRWVNVNVNAERQGWADGSATSATTAHYFYNTGISVTTTSAGPFDSGGMILHGGTYWIHSSRIFHTAKSAVTGNAWGGMVAISPLADLHVYGSAISGVDERSNGAAYGVYSLLSARFSAEGVNITATAANSASARATAVRAQWGGSAVIRGTRFNVTALTSGSPSPVLRRIETDGGSTVDAPYWLGSGATPPSYVTANWSVKGADTFIETDCAASGCAAVGTQSHLLSFDATTCTGSGGPWFDVTVKACR